MERINLPASQATLPPNLRMGTGEGEVRVESAVCGVEQRQVFSDQSAPDNGSLMIADCLAAALILKRAAQAMDRVYWPLLYKLYLWRVGKTYE